MWNHISDHSGEYLADTYLAHRSGAERTAYANISPDPLNAAAGIAWGHACKHPAGHARAGSCCAA